MESSSLLGLHYAVGLEPAMYPRLALNVQSSLLCIPSAGITATKASWLISETFSLPNMNLISLLFMSFHLLGLLVTRNFCIFNQVYYTYLLFKIKNNLDLFFTCFIFNTDSLFLLVFSSGTITWNFTWSHLRNTDLC